jgi:hypothetical protein
MATVAGRFPFKERRPDLLSGTPRAHTLDRWIFVAMAAWFILIVLTGFIPDSIMKVGMVQAGARPPFPIVLHMHAVVMGSFLLTLLVQSWLMATGRREYHMRLGVLGFGLAALLVGVGLVLVPTIYHQVWQGAHFGPPAMRERLLERASELDDIMLMQLQVGLLFPILLAIAFRARGGNAGFHKRMMFLATAIPLAAGIVRITALPQTMPASPLSLQLYVLLAVSPMFAWDVIRNRRVHEAYWIWLALYVPTGLVINLLWDRPWWHATARGIMGVA